MAYYVAGDTIQEPFISESLATGLTFTRVASYQAGSTVTWNPTIAEVGSGAYTFTYVTTTSSTTGSWVWVATASNGETVTWEFDVNATEPTIVTAAPSDGATRKELRQEIGRQFGQIVVLVADSGTDTTFVSPRRLTYPNNAYKGRRLYFVDGTLANLGETRDIISSTKTTGTLEWSDALPTDVQAGDEAELWGMSNAGAEPWEVEDMINDVISDAGRSYGVAVEATLADPFDADNPELDIPAAINRMIYQVLWQPEDSEEWVPIDRATSPGGYGYWVNRGLGTITVGGTWLLSQLDARSIKIIGDAYPAPLDDDTDVTDIPKQYIVAEVCSRLAVALVERNPDFAKARLALFSQRAMMARPYIQKRSVGSGWKVA